MGAGSRSAQQLTSLAIMATLAGVAEAQEVGRFRLNDSTRMAFVQFTAGRTYRVEVRPGTAQVIVRQQYAVRETQLAANPLGPGDSVSGGSGFLVLAGETGAHVLQLQTPGEAEVRVRVHDDAPGDVRRAMGRSTLIFSDIVTDTYSWVYLDTGVVYRVVADGNVYIAPRMLTGAPIHVAPLVRGGGEGTPVMVQVPGDHRLYTDPTGSLAVRIYVEAMDAAELACVRDPSTRGCRQRRLRLPAVLGPALFAAGAIMVLIIGKWGI